MKTPPLGKVSDEFCQLDWTPALAIPEPGYVCPRTRMFDAVPAVSITHPMRWARRIAMLMGILAFADSTGLIDLPQIKLPM